MTTAQASGEHGADAHHDHGDHPYHLVPNSAWPLFGAASAGLMALGGVFFMHGDGWILLLIGLLGVIGTMVGWWRDVVRESIHEKAHTSVVKIGLRFGMILFIASEVMFFVAFFWAFFNAALYPTEAVGGQWPPEGIQTIDPFSLPFMLTLILLLSSTTVTWAHEAIREGNIKDTVTGIGLTALLGIFFLSLQVYEYAHAHFGFTDGIYPSTFFMATGFHGFHVFIGTIFLIVCFFRARAGHFTKYSHFGFEAAAWYWHFVDVVWLFLFTCVYWWGG